MGALRWSTKRLEALYGYGGEHAGLVVEMMGGRAVGDADPAGHISHADVLRAHLCQAAAVAAVISWRRSP